MLVLEYRPGPRLGLSKMGWSKWEHRPKSSHALSGLPQTRWVQGSPWMHLIMQPCLCSPVQRLHVLISRESKALAQAYPGRGKGWGWAAQIGGLV